MHQELEVVKVMWMEQIVQVDAQDYATAAVLAYVV